MALKATVQKAEVTISNMDRGYYQTHLLTLAQHPSETRERLMLRLVVFILHASNQLVFTRGLFADDEPELWQKDYSDNIELWIELGEPEERRLRQACGRAKQVYLYTYGRGSSVWWLSMQHKISHLKNLSIFRIAPTTLAELTELHNQQSLQLQASIQDGQLWLSCGEQCVLIEAKRLFGTG